MRRERLSYSKTRDWRERLRAERRIRRNASQTAAPSPCVPALPTPAMTSRRFIR